MKIVKNMQISNPIVNLAGKLAIPGKNGSQNAVQLLNDVPTRPLPVTLDEQKAHTRYTPRKQISYPLKPPKQKNAGEVKSSAIPFSVGKYADSTNPNPHLMSYRSSQELLSNPGLAKPPAPSSRQDYLLKADYSWIIRRGSRDPEVSNSPHRLLGVNSSIGSLARIGASPSIQTPYGHRSNLQTRQMLEEAQFVYRANWQQIGSNFPSCTSLGNSGDLSLNHAHKQSYWLSREDIAGAPNSLSGNLTRALVQPKKQTGPKDRLKISTELADFMRMQLSKKQVIYKTSSKKFPLDVQPSKSKVCLGIPSKLVVIPYKEKEAVVEVEPSPTVLITKLSNPDFKDSRKYNNVDEHRCDTQGREFQGSIESHHEHDANAELISVRSVFQSESNQVTRKNSAQGGLSRQKLSVPEILDSSNTLHRHPSSGATINMQRCRTQQSPDRKPSANPLRMKMSRQKQTEDIRAAPLAGWGPSSRPSRSPELKTDGDDDHTLLDLEDYISRTVGHTH